MIYTPENSKGCVCIDVLKAEYIYKVVGVDTRLATVEVVDDPSRLDDLGEVVTKKLQFSSVTEVVRVDSPSIIFLCESRRVIKLSSSEIQPDTKE